MTIAQWVGLLCLTFLFGCQRGTNLSFKVIDAKTKLPLENLQCERRHYQFSPAGDFVVTKVTRHQSNPEGLIVVDRVQQDDSLRFNHLGYLPILAVVLKGDKLGIISGAVDADGRVNPDKIVPVQAVVEVLMIPQNSSKAVP